MLVDRRRRPSRAVCDDATWSTTDDPTGSTTVDVRTPTPVDRPALDRADDAVPTSDPSGWPARPTASRRRPACPPTDPQVLDAIVKAYDVRGTVPDQLNADVAHALGVGFARFAGAPRVLVGRDMRPSGPELVDAFARGVMEQGVDVVDLGLASTDLVYFAAGTLDAPGAMFTASHNPAQYNGVKFCLVGARAGRPGHRPGRRQGDVAADGARRSRPAPAARAGLGRRRATCSTAFADHVVSFIDTAALRPMRVVADTANGMGGLVVPAVFERIPQITLEVMYGELDGTFPNHPADPLQPANQRDLQARVVVRRVRRRARLRRRRRPRVRRRRDRPRPQRLAPPRRCSPQRSCARIPGATILHNLICSQRRARGDPRARRRAGAHQGRPLVHQAGHGRDRRGVRRRALGALLLPRQLPRRQRPDRQRCSCSTSSAGRDSDLSVVRKPFERYSSSGEINTQVDDPDAVIERVAERRSPTHDQDRLDGLTVDCGPWWFNLRPSNTEPLLRLNLEAADRDDCDQRVAEVLALITERLTHRMTGSPHGTRPALLAILACPQDKGPLYYLGDEDGLYNPRLHRRYVVRDGIPVMLIDEAVAVDDAEHEAIMARVAAEGIEPDVRLTAGRRHAYREASWHTLTP